MNSGAPEDALFEKLAEETDWSEESPASSRLKSRIYSAMVQAQRTTGPLKSLSAHDGAQLCVFEQLVKIAPVPDSVKSKNPCQICHARVLAENLEHAPIYWPNCPYVRFHKL